MHAPCNAIISAITVVPDIHERTLTVQYIHKTLGGDFVGAVVVAQVLPHSTPSLDDDFFFRFDFIPSSSLVHILLIASTRAKPPCRQEYDQIDQSATHYP